jgi:hypothetical protein
MELPNNIKLKQIEAKNQLINSFDILYEIWCIKYEAAKDETKIKMKKIIEEIKTEIFWRLCE